jgi:hypothetical protein
MYLWVFALESDARAFHVSYTCTETINRALPLFLLACLLALSFTSSYKNSIPLLYSRRRYKGTQLLALITLACTFTVVSRNRFVLLVVVVVVVVAVTAVHSRLHSS